MKTNDIANWLLEESIIEAKQYITEAKKKLTKEEIFEEATDACYKKIQSLVGQKHGDLAAQFYDEDDFKKVLMPYIEAEMKEAGMLNEAYDEKYSFEDYTNELKNTIESAKKAGVKITSVSKPGKGSTISSKKYILTFASKADAEKFNKDFYDNNKDNTLDKHLMEASSDKFKDVRMAEASEMLNDACLAIKNAINYLETEEDRKKFKILLKQLDSLNYKIEIATFGKEELKEAKNEMKDPTRKEMEKFLEGKKKEYDAEDFDIQAAIHYYASEYHSGQSSNLYSALSTSKYKPGRSESGAEDVSDACGMLYSELQDKFGR